MTEKDTVSMATVQMKPDYAASEVYSTASEPPPVSTVKPQRPPILPFLFAVSVTNSATNYPKRNKFPILRSNYLRYFGIGRCEFCWYLKSTLIGQPPSAKWVRKMPGPPPGVIASACVPQGVCAICLHAGANVSCMLTKWGSLLAVACQLPLHA